MFCFISKTLLHGRDKITAPQTMKLFCTLRKNPSILSLRLFSTTSNQPQSFTVSYLINTCGLSPESALHASKFVNFETPDKPDSVLAFFKKHGFSKTQIATISKRRPALLLYDVEKILLPKVEFFYSKGASRSDLATFVPKYPTILAISLEKQIIPSFNLLRNMLLSDENVINAIKLYPRIFSYDFNAYILPNINVLRDTGVPEYNIVKLLHWLPKAFFRAPVQVKENAEKLKGMGFNPERVIYLVAVYALGSLSKSTLEKKFDTFKKCGWSEEEVLEAFRRYPLIMTISEDKIMAVMDFLMSKMGFEVSSLAKYPRILAMSLEKRLVPRGLFAQDLLSKGLLEEKIRLPKLFESSKELFLNRFVYAYGEKAPELLKLYEEKFNLAVGGKGKIQKS
ncbi:Transcription termination factor [Theobroma cacao]|nr:Transcription termination factor [Theobroma cacao]